ncbi:hypothetical protein CDAR_257411 [Caerostris darwini]|uniref:Uncharacterized protein n=1 Tax=Caerostris darwini TaxID=1538125 RepID=A0AAV4TEB0_9ARAC|nr:hypothetical protein CDAR_257411 [Caerostris darwini]
MFLPGLKFLPIKTHGFQQNINPNQIHSNKLYPSTILSISCSIYKSTLSKDPNSNMWNMQNHTTNCGDFPKKVNRRGKTRPCNPLREKLISIKNTRFTRAQYIYSRILLSLYGQDLPARQQGESCRHGLTATPISSGLPGARSGIPPPFPLPDNPGEKAYPQCLLHPLRNHRFEKLPSPHTAWTADLCSLPLDSDTVQRILIT